MHINLCVRLLTEQAQGHPWNKKSCLGGWSMDKLLRWVDREVYNLPLVLMLHSAIFVGLALVVFLFWR
jgi:hypothetical protein